MLVGASNSTLLVGKHLVWGTRKCSKSKYGTSWALGPELRRSIHLVANRLYSFGWGSKLGIPIIGWLIYRLHSSTKTSTKIRGS